MGRCQLSYCLARSKSFPRKLFKHSWNTATRVAVAPTQQAMLYNVWKNVINAMQPSTSTSARSPVNCTTTQAQRRLFNTQPQWIRWTHPLNPIAVRPCDTCISWNSHSGFKRLRESWKCKGHTWYYGIYRASAARFLIFGFGSALCPVGGDWRAMPIKRGHRCWVVRHRYTGKVHYGHEHMCHFQKSGCIYVEFFALSLHILKFHSSLLGI